MGKLVYLLDDDPDILLLFDYILNGNGFRTENFTTVRQFLARIEVVLPDIILLDIKLPDGNGLDVCRFLSSQLPTSAIPVLIISGYPENKRKYKAAGAWGFITKPFTGEELVDMINAL